MDIRGGRGSRGSSFEIYLSYIAKYICVKLQNVFVLNC